MMRALYTAATGMIAQQSNVDNISNNLSNVNTVGYKQEKMEFKSLLYQTIRRVQPVQMARKSRSLTGRTWYQSGIQHLYLYTGVTDGK